MADYSYVNTDPAQIYATVLKSLMDSCQEPLYPGDERRIFADALSAVMVAVYSEFNDKMKQRTLQYARGPVLDAIGARYDVHRIQPSAASATFRFSVENPRSENIVIPEGTKITSNGSIYFATVQATVLQAGNRFVDTRADCTQGGAAHNGYAPGSLTTLVDLIPYIVSVSNTTATAGGDDGEPYTVAGDDRYRERIQLAPATQSTAGPESAYRYFAMTADPSIIDVAVDSPAPCTVKIYPLVAGEDGGTLPSEEILQQVQAACSADDVKPLTDQVQALAPSTVSYDVQIKYYCNAETETAAIQAIEGPDGAISQYNRWQTSALARDVNPDKLRKLLLDSGAERLEITRPVYAPVSKSQVAKFSGHLTVSHEVIK